MRNKIIEVLAKITGYSQIELETPVLGEFGDYSSNVAMIIAKKEDKNPQDVAKELVEKIRSDAQLSKIVSKVEVAGPGFINFWLTRTVLASEPEKIIKAGEKYGSSDLGAGKTVVIDYSSPNIAKQFGIGHMRSTVIGQALFNLDKFLGYKVIGDNHLGDWGTQFGALLTQIQNSKIKVQSMEVEDLEKLYVDFHKKAQENPELWDEARAQFKKLEQGDPKAREAWKVVVDTSLTEFNRIYGLLGVKIDYAYGESFYEDKMPEVIDEIRGRGLSKKSEGAEILEFPSTNSRQVMPPAMIIKSDGATTYFTRDLATIKFRIEEWNPDIFIYEVGSDQILHFRQLFAAAKLLGWNEKRHYEHVAHGLIRFPHGKMSTRFGETVRLEEVLKEAINKARRIINKSGTGRGLSESEKESVAKAVGIGAVKYFDLMHHPATDIIFDWEKVFILEGNSAPYLQYTCARTRSIAEKSTHTFKGGSLQALYSNFNKEELKVLRTLAHFSEIVENSAKNYSPNLLANYLFDLAQKYNNFYNMHRILETADSERLRVNSKKTKIPNTTQDFRLALTSATGQVLKNGLTLLGIETPERM